MLGHLELYLLFDCFAEKCAENEAATAIANALKPTPERKTGGSRKKDRKQLLQTLMQTRLKMTTG